MNNLDYGIIGNCKSAALVSRDGSLDWCCLPNFNSASVFAKLLDEKKGGSFSFIVDETYTTSQKYLWKTNILCTTFASEEAAFQVIDFMPRYREDNGNFYAPPDVIRFIHILKGQPKIRVKFDPKLDYAREKTYTENHRYYLKSFTREGKYDSLYLYTNLGLDDVLNGEEMMLTGNAYFLMGYHEKLREQSLERAYLKFQRTKTYWMNWSEETTKFPHYNREIIRSALVLKALTFEKTGAVLAAATTSLPETIGEVRNWDYRFCWIRDASMVIKVVSELGHKNSAKRYLQFIIDLMPDKDEKLQIMYGINKEKTLTERTLNHFDGYKGSKPVRVGNAAYKQRQNDTYGILMDVIYEQLKNFSNDIENVEELWSITKGIVWIVGKHWEEPDKGIWEFRGEDKHFTFSKVLCWVALDRAIKVANMFGKTRKLERWTALEQKIKEDIHENAWNSDINAFVQCYGSRHLDASVLLMEPYGFIHARDPKYVSTVKAIEEGLSNDGLLYRYKNEDDFGLPSSSFTICTFWFINALFKIGEEEKALEQFERLLGYSNHLGLFGEDIDFKTKRLLGNFPQAYSHLALIECAINFSTKQKDERILESIG